MRDRSGHPLIHANARDAQGWGDAGATAGALVGRAAEGNWPSRDGDGVGVVVGPVVGERGVGDGR